MESNASKICPLVSTFHFISKRWMLLVLRAVHSGNTHFSEIRRAIPGISARLLSERLRELSEIGFIARDCPIDCQTPRYRIADKGQSFIECLSSLDDWVVEYAFPKERPSSGKTPA